MRKISFDAMEGSCAADAVAMPVHWYYDTKALDRDYGVIDRFLAPRNPHPDSILWRSKYVARNNKGEILHDQAQYWGRRGIHYHQFLKAGENTVNFRLGRELYWMITSAGRYDADAWLDRYIEVMRTPNWHPDTYVEEYHRAFFDNLAQGKHPRGCGIDDIHIGGLTPVPFLLAALIAIGETDVYEIVQTVRRHLELTHRNSEVLRAGEALVRMILRLEKGENLRLAIEEHGAYWLRGVDLESMAQGDDRMIIGERYSPACYLPGSFSASLVLTWKHADDFATGVCANARCGGDSCHRGVVVGGLLGAVLGVPDSFTPLEKPDPAVK